MSLIRISAIACLTLIALVAFPNAAEAQSKRMVLIEEATNASCPPCAVQNPTFHAYLMRPENQGRFVTIVWRAWWPGSDVMHSANVAMNTDRIQYYGISSVPTSFINGMNQTSPIDTATVETHVAAGQGMSPITITIDQEQTGADLTGEITVTSTEAISNATLRIVAVEGYHYYDAAGSNGEKDFSFIPRHMLPTDAGTAVNLAPDGSMTVPVTYTILPDFNQNEMYLVAYVQNNATKEVLQAAQSKPFLVLEGESALMYYEKADNTPHTFTRTFEAPVTGDYTYDIADGLPEGWTASVTANSTPWSGEAMNFTAETSVEINVTVTPSDAPKRYGTVNLTIHGPRAASGTMALKYYNNPIDVLMFRRDEGNPQIAENYAAGFEEAANWKYAIVDEGDDALFNPFDHSIFAMEVGKSILEKADVDLLKNYMDTGGRLWLAGAEIAWALADTGALNQDPPIYQDMDFLANYLRAEYVADDPDATTDNHSVRGFAGDPIGNNLAFQISGGVKNQNQPDVLRPVNGGIPCFYYAKEEDIAGIRYNGDGYALVYFGFGMEGTTNKGWIRNAFTRTIEWLLSATPVDRIPSLADGFSVAAYPNPATGVTRIPLTLTKAQDVSVAIYNVYGQRVATVFEGHATVGTTGYHVDIQSLPAGAYVIRAHAGGNVTTSMLSVLR